MQLVLSLFSGIGLLDKAFREAGFCVVSAGDLIMGQDIRDFTGVKNKFNGVIGGSPCQDFSTLKRNPGNYSLQMLYEFLRVVSECEPDWFLLENVKSVPNVTDLLTSDVTHLEEKSVTVLRNYSHQRIDINQGWYDSYTRLRHIQFCSKDGLFLQIPRGAINEDIKGGCATANDSRSFKELCLIQGLSSNFDLPDFNVKGKKRAVGNGVPLSVGRVLANEVFRVTHLEQKSVTVQHNLFSFDDVTHLEQKSVTVQHNLCACGCGRFLSGRKKTYDSSCRKRLQRIKLKKVLKDEK